jgi:hypothetical protein
VRAGLRPETPKAKRQTPNNGIQKRYSLETQKDRELRALAFSEFLLFVWHLALWRLKFAARDAAESPLTSAARCPIKALHR